MKTLSDMDGKGPLVNMDYAATFWAQHLRDTMSVTLKRDTLGDQGDVITFLRAKLLEWFECSSLLDRLPHAVEALRILADITSVSSIHNIHLI